jgi:6-pyruvoyltetrahydropterin/6-carboxytetrahydropterin synthase
MTNDETMTKQTIRVANDDLTFSAGHFITLDDGCCERLHGHSYRVAAEVGGPLNENQYVVDFVAVRDVLKAILSELDHRVLLPGQHPAIHVSAGLKEVEVTFADRRWVLPKDDCLVLPLANTTTELLAEYIGQRLLADLKARSVARPERIRIEVGEGTGFLAVWEWG